ncbi:MAG: bacterio-opsin activator [candidate division WOR-3 bacterium]
MPVVTMPFVSEMEIEQLIGRVFMKAIDLLGGLNKLAEFRSLTWLPSLARACFVVVLKEEYLKSHEEIAQKVGITKNTVKNILYSDPHLVLQRIENIENLAKEEPKNLKTHIAGAIAKLAYREIKQGREAQTLLHYCSSMIERVAEMLEIPWVYIVLRHTKGVKYPIHNSEELEEKFREVVIKGVRATDIIRNLHYPIESPAALLHEIKEYLKTHSIA